MKRIVPIVLLALGSLILIALAVWGIDRLMDANGSGNLLAILSRDRSGASSEISTSARIRERGTLRIGVRPDIPHFAVENNGNFEGFQIDLGRELARRWLGDSDAALFVPVAVAERIPRLASGDVDILLTDLVRQQDREAFIDFSQPYFLGGEGMLVLASRQIDSLEQMAGERVLALPGASALTELQDAATSRGVELMWDRTEEIAAGLTALRNEEATALVGNIPTLLDLAKANPDLQVLTERILPEPWVLGLPEDDSYFRQTVNFTLQDMQKDGSYDEIYRRWFPESEAPSILAETPGEWPYSFDTLPEERRVASASVRQEIEERGILRVGVSPDIGTDAAGQPTGFEVDLVREIAQRVLNDANAVQFVQSPLQEQFEQLANGELDLIASGLVRRREWADAVDFSQSYLTSADGSEALSFGLPLDDSTLRDLIDETLTSMRTDGTYSTLFERWYGDGPPAIVDTGATPSETGQRVSNPIPTTVRSKSAIELIRERGNTMTVGVKYDFAPFGFLNEEGQVQGFDIDIVQAIADAWGIEVQFVPVTSSDRIEKLAAGEVDLVAASMTHKKERDATIDFSQTYFLDGQSLLVRRDSGIESIEDLGGRTVAAIQGSTSIDQIQALADANEISIEITPFLEYPPGLAALINGQVDALTTDSVALSQFALENPELVVVGGLLTEEPYGMGVPPGDSYFTNLLNFTLQELKEDGTYDELYRKWFGEDSIPYPVEILPGEWPYTFDTSPTDTDATVRSRLEAVLDRRQILAGVKYDFEPFGYVDDQGQVQGFDIDIVREFAARWLGDRNAVEFVPVTSSDRIEKLAAGEVDLVAASMTHKKERDETIDFSQTYFLDGQSLLVRRDSGIESIEDLGGRTVAAIQGSTSIDQIRSAGERLGVELEVLPFQEYPPGLAALINGQVDALTTDSVALSQFAKQSPELAVVGGRFTQEPYGIGVPNYDHRFHDLVNFTLQAMKQDGTYDRLYRKWFGDDEPYPIEIWPGDSYLDVNMVPMIYIPEGEFLRGFEGGFPDERPESTVYLDDYYIDQYEVTNQQYQECVQAGSCELPRLPRSVNFANYYADSIFRNYPIIWVRWQDAADFCAFAGKRLPTEAEWEKAARGADGRLYPWGGDAPASRANYNYLEQDVAPVGLYPDDVSPYGALDMAGNVREWVGDWYQWNYYAESELTNPSGPATGVTRVLRGAGWNDSAIYLRTSARKNFLPDSFDSNLGFRCATSNFPPS